MLRHRCHHMVFGWETRHRVGLIEWKKSISCVPAREESPLIIPQADVLCARNSATCSSYVYVSHNNKLVWEWTSRSTAHIAIDGQSMGQWAGVSRSDVGLANRWGRSEEKAENKNGTRRRNPVHSARPSSVQRTTRRPDVCLLRCCVCVCVTPIYLLSEARRRRVFRVPSYNVKAETA